MFIHYSMTHLLSFTFIYRHLHLNIYSLPLEYAPWHTKATTTATQKIVCLSILQNPDKGRRKIINGIVYYNQHQSHVLMHWQGKYKISFTLKLTGFRLDIIGCAATISLNSKRSLKQYHWIQRVPWCTICNILVSYAL